MNPLEPATPQLEELRRIELWLRSHDDWREQLNSAVFGIANRLKVHPHQLAIYILVRTASL